MSHLFCVLFSVIDLGPSVYMVLWYCWHFTVMRLKDIGSLGSCISVIEIVVVRNQACFHFLFRLAFKNKAGNKK